MKAEARREVMELLERAGRSKTAKKLYQKFLKTNTLSKREIKILRDLVQKRMPVAA